MAGHERHDCGWCGIDPAERPDRPSPQLHGAPLRRCEACDRYLRRNGRERPLALIREALDRKIAAEAAPYRMRLYPPRRR